MKNLERHLRIMTVRALNEFDMIQDGDHIAIGLSGGKDSWTLMHVLQEIRRKSYKDFKLTGVTVDYGNPNFQTAPIEAYMRERGWDYYIEKTHNADTIERHLTPGSSICAFCARLRRGKLYGAAHKINANKVALGHHGDDLAETLLLNFFFSGKLRSMAPKVLADNGTITLIRPMINCLERDIVDFAKTQEFPIIACNCPHSGQEIEANRKRIKQMISAFEQEAAPYVRSTMITALKNINPSHLLDNHFHEF
jgi:tRNA 2-thiocytidine biosynthesis protein TtcA